MPVRTAPAGLCESCRNVRILEAKTGSRFFLCELSAVDPAFPKYPPIPVLRCAGYQPKAAPGENETARDRSAK